ncbi:hypothetical protein [Rubrimonas sp.]|uniref:hypothetical protein n=1 Tax=Rubrimonas sp. TaxID=2036015 RepID=UPI002FDDD727
MIGGAAALLATPFAAWSADRPPPRDAAVGKVRFSQIQVAFMWSGSVGGGVLSFEGRDHGFTMGGVGYGGIGASRVEAEGEVYGLTHVGEFEGAYAQVRYGVAAGSDSLGELWLQNVEHGGVEIRLQSRRQGLALSLGGDAVYIRFD